MVKPGYLPQLVGLYDPRNLGDVPRMEFSSPACQSQISSLTLRMICEEMEVLGSAKPWQDPHRLLLSARLLGGKRSTV